LHTLAIDVEKLIPVSGQLVALDRVVAEAVEKAVQAAEANALRKAADLFSGKLNGYTPGEIVPMILSLIPPASQTLLDARDAAVRLKEDELLWSLDFNDAYNSGYLTTRGRELLTKRMDELRAASQPTQGGNNERSRG
jgi:hypothetical protein